MQGRRPADGIIRKDSALSTRFRKRWFLAFYEMTIQHFGKPRCKKDQGFSIRQHGLKNPRLPRCNRVIVFCNEVASPNSVTIHGASPPWASSIKPYKMPHAATNTMPALNKPDARRGGLDGRAAMALRQAWQ